MTSAAQDTPAPQPYASSRPGKMKIALMAALVVIVGIGVTVGVILTNKEASNQDSLSSIPPAQVSITSGAFSPATIQIKKDQAVVWANDDEQPHTLAISAGDGSTPDNENSMEQINQGESYSYVFSETGTFNYYDTTDSLRYKGVIVVE